MILVDFSLFQRVQHYDVTHHRSLHRYTVAQNYSVHCTGWRHNKRNNIKIWSGARIHYSSEPGTQQVGISLFLPPSQSILPFITFHSLHCTDFCPLHSLPFHTLIYPFRPCSLTHTSAPFPSDAMHVRGYRLKLCNGSENSISQLRSECHLSYEITQCYLSPITK